MSTDPPRLPLLLIVASMLLVGPRAAFGQQENPVYVDDSPRAWELFLLAGDQAADNLGEAVRLYQELLDDYGTKLLPITRAAADHFTSVRGRVLDRLSGNPGLLNRYRIAEQAEAARLLHGGHLQRVALTRSLTESGLEALLRLAQENLESAHFHSALDWLQEAREHPDLDARRAAHCWYMIGAAASYIDRSDLFGEAAAALDALGSVGQRLRGQLDGVAQARRPDLHNGITSFDTAGAAELHDLVAQPIWSLPLDAMPLSRRTTAPRGGDPPSLRYLENLRRSGALLTATPTVAGSRIYVNEGRIIHAVDRFTGRAVWPPFVQRSQTSSVDKGNRSIGDLNVVSVREGTVVTITGHAYTDAARTDRTVICLDADTGRLRWASHIDRLSRSDELDTLFPHGTPIISDGMVFVLARKVSRQLLTSCYLIALGLDDGRLRWARHVASSGGIRSRFARPFSTPVLHEGDVVVATAIGAIARFDATTGQTRWLRRYNPPLTPYRAERRPWEISGPVITSRGVFALRPDHREVLLLDWRTGDDVDATGSATRDTWNTPRYLLAAGNMVFGIGSGIRAFRDESLRLPAWVFPRQSPDPQEKSAYDLDAIELRGRVQVMDGGLVVPTSEGVLLLDSQTGEVTHRIDMDVVGNPLAAGPQLILAATDELQAYMPLGRAEQMLRQQIAADPTDPAPALALMRLGVRVRDLEMALEAADLAIHAINGAAGRPSQVARDELFEILLDLDREAIALTQDEGEALHAMIGVVAHTPSQRVEYLLAYGDWLSSGALGPAVEAYQAILSTSSLSDVPRRHGGVVRPASTWAANRVAALIEEHGPGVYRPQAEFASGLLVRLGPDADPEALVALAREYPFADASLDAAGLAARRYAADGLDRAALAALTDAWMVAPERDRAAPVLGALVAASMEAGWPRYARDVLRYAVTTFGRIELDTGSGHRDASEWLAGLDEPAGTPRLPRVGDVRDVVQRRDGVIVPLLPGAAARLPADRVLVYDAPGITLLSGPELLPVWSTVLPVPGAPVIIRFDDEGLLLWVDMPGDDPKAVMLDPADGSRRWVTTDLGALKNETLHRMLTDDLLPRGQQIDPTQTLPLVTEKALILVRRSGRVMAIELADGSTPSWQRVDTGVLHQVHRVVLGDTALVLAGTRQAADGRELAARIVALEPDTGRTLFEITPLGGTPVNWMTIGPLGSLVYGCGMGIEAVDLRSGRRWWSAVSPDAHGTSRGWSAAGQIIVQGPSGRRGDGVNPLRAIRMSAGDLSLPFDMPQRGEWNRRDLRALLVNDGRIFARYGERVVRFSPSGQVLGADVVSDHRDFTWLIPAADRLLAVSLFRSEQVPGEARRRQHIYRVYGFSENCRLMGEAVELPPMTERLEQVVAIDGWLLLSTAASTLVVPMP